MNAWMIAALALTVAILPCLAVGLCSGLADALVAFELASVLTVSVLIVLAEGFHRQPFIDLALILAVVSLVGGLAFARFLESEP